MANIAVRMLTNIATHGFNKCVDGLYINWDSHGVNYNGTGLPDANPCSRHDPLTDLRYLHSLLLYKRDTGSAAFDGQIAKFLPIVKKEFLGTAVQQGWVYDEFADMFKLTGDPVFAAIVRHMLADYAFKPGPASRPDYGFEEASALVQSGRRHYVALGRQRIATLWKSSFDPTLDLIWTPPVLKTAAEADIAVALARAGMNKDARLILQGLHRTYDPIHGGYGEGLEVTASGSTTLQPKKTGGRMANIYELAVILGDGPLEKSMLQVIVDHIYQPALDGVLYEQRPNWGEYVFHHSVVEDWVTSEGNGDRAHIFARH